APQDNRTCSICGIRFTRRSALVTHINTHTGARPHVCGVAECGAAFAARSNMLRHRRMHDPAAVAAAEALERQQMAAQPPPPAVFNAPIVNELVGGSDSGAPVNVQWMPPNSASRAYRRYPDVI
ncbi:hypothetical protein FB107DRAFT_194451, partial [Schizophyllum commune]